MTGWDVHWDRGPADLEEAFCELGPDDARAMLASGRPDDHLRTGDLA